MTTQQIQTTEAILDYYRRATTTTAPGKYAAMFDQLPNDVAGLVRVVQGLAIHEYAASYYGVEVPEDRKKESHIRSVEQMLDRLLEIDGRPLSEARPPVKRLVGVCHHFMMFLLAMLRAKGIPTRGRCGFGSYFNPGFFEDHWLCEVWDANEERWTLVDPQFDEVWRRESKIDHDILDVPRDRFLVASDAWTLCREGKADASKFGIFRGNMRGLWFIATDLIHDVAALNKVELLPWDVWGAAPKPNEKLDDGQIAYFDRLASLTAVPDKTYAELRDVYESDEGVRVPPSVFNAILNRVEAV